MFNPVNFPKCCFLLVCLLLADLSPARAQTGVRQNLISQTTFEGSNYLSGWYNSQHCCSYSVQQSAEQIKAGSNSLRFEIKSTDPPTSGAIRSEIGLDSDPLNQDRWYGFSVFLKDWVDDDAGESVFQWAPDNASGSASMALLASGGRFTYVTNSGGSANNILTDLGPVISNNWVDFVIHIRWATDTTGLLQVWKNGVLVINRSGIKTTSVSSYFKAGINKFGWGTQSSAVSQRILFLDEVRVGNASAVYNDVAPFRPRRDYFRGQ